MGFYARFRLWTKIAKSCGIFEIGLPLSIFYFIKTSNNLHRFSISEIITYIGTTKQKRDRMREEETNGLIQWFWATFVD